MIQKQLEEMLTNNMLNKEGQHLLEHLVEAGEDSSAKKVYYGADPLAVPALVAAQATSCDTLLDQAKAIGAMFENNVRHIGLPTQVSWMFSH